MKKRLSVLPIIALAAFSVWQYFIDGRKGASPQFVKPTEIQPKSPDTLTSDIVFADYDVLMRDDPIGQNADAPADYYMLVLSWSPGFCETQREKYGRNLPYSFRFQCGADRNFGWVVHGLWPQNANARSASEHPRFCRGDLPALPQNIIKPYLTMSPSAELLQGEWEKHGSCAFDSAEKYFAKEQDLFTSLHLPLQNLNRNELFRWLKQHNPQLKNAYLNASRNEIFICYDKRWQVMNCPK